METFHSTDLIQLKWDTSLIGEKKKIRNQKKKLNIIWVDQNINSSQNQKYINSLKISPSVKRVLTLQTSEEALDMIQQKQASVDLLITNGSLGKNLVSDLYKKFPFMLPYFQVVIFCGNLEYHKTWAKKFGLIRFVTNNFAHIETLIKNFERRMKSDGGVFEFTQPFVAMEDAIQEIPMKFIMEAHTFFNAIGSKEEILRELKKAAFRKDLSETNLKYSIMEIDQTIELFLQEDYNWFKMYTKECFVYRETNRRLRKYLFQIPSDIFHFKMEIKSGKYENPEFLKLSPVLPFVFEITKQIVRLNDPDFLGINQVFHTSTCWRGVELTKEQKNRFQENIGKIVGFPAFTSASFLKKNSFNSNCKMQIIVPERIDEQLFPIRIDSDSCYPSESEVLFPAASLFKIVKVIEKSNLFECVLEYVPFDNPNLIEKQGLEVMKNICFNNHKLTTDELNKTKLCLIKTKYLIELSLVNSGIRGQKLSHLCEGLRPNNTLKELNLSENQIGSQGAKELSLVLKRSPIAILKLWNNDIRSEGLKYLSESLKENTSLKFLSLGANKICASGIKYLSEALTLNCNLFSLLLGYNNIKDKGAKYLAEALSVNHNLKKLNIGWNSIGQKGAKALANTLKNNKSLKELYLCSNSIGDNGTQLFCVMLEINNTLELLNLIDNQIHQKGILGILKIKKHIKCRIEF